MYLHLFFQPKPPAKQRPPSPVAKFRSVVAELGSAFRDRQTKLQQNSSSNITEQAADAAAASVAVADNKKTVAAKRSAKPSFDVASQEPALLTADVGVGSLSSSSLNQVEHILHREPPLQLPIGDNCTSSRSQQRSDNWVKVKHQIGNQLASVLKLWMVNTRARCMRSNRGHDKRLTQ